MIKAFLYDANGHDQEISSSLKELPPLADHQLLWLDVVGYENADLDVLQKLLKVTSRSIDDLHDETKPLRLSSYGEYLHCRVLAIADPEEKPAPLPRADGVRLDLLVGANWLVTVQQSELAFIRAFRDQDRGETLIGGLSSASLAASLLDWHLSRYLDALEALAGFTDKLDVRVLAGQSLDERLLDQVLVARRFVARLRRYLGPQRTIFYGLARPDLVAANPTAEGDFRALENRFDRVMDAIDHGRDLVQGSFDLFTTRVAETTNVLIRRLTFISLMLGAIGAVAGIFGMNFQTPYTETGATGFWLVVGFLLVVVAASAFVSRRRKWI